MKTHSIEGKLMYACVTRDERIRSCRNLAEIASSLLMETVSYEVQGELKSLPFAFGMAVKIRAMSPRSTSFKNFSSSDSTTSIMEDLTSEHSGISSASPSKRNPNTLINLGWQFIIEPDDKDVVDDFAFQYADFVHPPTILVGVIANDHTIDESEVDFISDMEFQCLRDRVALHNLLLKSAPAVANPATVVMPVTSFSPNLRPDRTSLESAISDQRSIDDSPQSNPHQVTIAGLMAGNIEPFRIQTQFLDSSLSITVTPQCNTGFDMGNSTSNKKPQWYEDVMEN